MDLVLTGFSPVLHAGGSCGNVLTILAWLGWHSMPVARLGEGWMAERIRTDMEQFGVDTSLIGTGPGGRTPLVVEVPAGPTGRIHRFLDRDPVTSEKFPVFRSLPPRYARTLARKHLRAGFFYTDMSSRAAVILAAACREGNGGIFFEPKSMRYPNTFHECLDLADIVKYSADEPVSPAVVSRSRAQLVIETRGDRGLRYLHGGRWREQPAFDVEGIVDTAGAGDWCSAGIIHVLLGFTRPWEEDGIEEALRSGQAMAALACKFPGARGIMYALTKDEFCRAFRAILGNGDWEAPGWRPVPPPDRDAAVLAEKLGLYRNGLLNKDFL